MLPRTERFAKLLGDGRKFQRRTNLFVVLVAGTAGDTVNPDCDSAPVQLSVDALPVLEFHCRDPVAEGAHEVEGVILQLRNEGSLSGRSLVVFSFSPYNHNCGFFEN